MPGRVPQKSSSFHRLCLSLQPPQLMSLPLCEHRFHARNDSRQMHGRLIAQDIGVAVR